MLETTVQQLSYAQLVQKVLQKSKNGFAKLFLDENDILRLLQDNARAQVIEFRTTARQIGALMRAMADPKTEALEPLERLRARRANMLAFAGQLENFRVQLETAATATPDEGGKVTVDAEIIKFGKRIELEIPKKVLPSWLMKQAQAIQLQINQASQEIAALDQGELRIAEETFATYEESYTVAKHNLVQAEEILDQAENRAPGLMKAVKAFKDAVELRDAARGQSAEGGDAVNSFMNDLTKEMEQARGEYRADKDLDADLDASRPVTFEDRMAKFDAEAGNASVLDEIRNAAAGK